MLQQRYERLQDILRELDSVVVAFSGGVDSTFLLKAAIETLGKERVHAVTADSETYPAEELAEAKRLASGLGASHEVIETSELAIPGYAENDANRCYFCKKHLFELLVPVLEKKRYRHLVYGLIADDMGEHRPGVKAAIEHGVRGPLQEAGLTKTDIRRLSKDMELATWNKPSFACLSSRVAYGQTITSEVLGRIGEAERFIRALGIAQVRVRTQDSTARIEVEQDDLVALLQNRESIVERLKALGYKYVSMDLTGYRSGSMNLVLPESEAVGG